MAVLAAGEAQARFGRELALVLLPTMVCLVVWRLLRRCCTRGPLLARGAAAVLATLFVAFCFLSVLSIGVLLFPTAALLAVAVAATQPPPAGPYAHRACRRVRVPSTIPWWRRERHPGRSGSRPASLFLREMP